MTEIHRIAEAVVWGVVLSIALSMCCTRLHCYWRAYKDDINYSALMGKYAKWQWFHAVFFMLIWLVLLL